LNQAIKEMSAPFHSEDFIGKQINEALLTTISPLQSPLNDELPICFLLQAIIREAMYPLSISEPHIGQTFTTAFASTFSAAFNFPLPFSLSYPFNGDEIIKTAR